MQTLFRHPSRLTAALPQLVLRACGALLALALAGCASPRQELGSGYEPPPQFLNAEVEQASGGNPSAVAPERWWQVFGSAKLNELVELAERRNHDLAAALSSLERSRAAARGAGAAILPQAEAGLSSEARDPSAGSGQNSPREAHAAGIFVNWELDLFGRARNAARAARFDAEAEAALYQDLLLALQADVATRYFELARYQSEIEIVQRGIETRRKSAELVAQRFEAGTVTELDVAQAEALLASAEAEGFALRRAQNSSLYALALLVGETPATFRFELEPVAVEPPAISAGIPASLLGRRPDVRAAERSLGAARSRVASSRAAFFPSLSLNAVLGQSATDWGRLFDEENAFELIGGDLALPLFQGGRNRASAQEAQAAYRSAWSRLKQASLEAIAEAEDQLQALRLLGAQREALTRSFSAFERAREVSLAQYESGLLDFFAVLDAERSALQAEQQLARLRGQELISTVALIRALGGSW